MKALHSTAGRATGSLWKTPRRAGVGRNKKWVGRGCGFADFDNDGWPDLFVVNGHVYPEIDKAGEDRFSAADLSQSGKWPLYGCLRNRRRAGLRRLPAVAVSPLAISTMTAQWTSL